MLRNVQLDTIEAVYTPDDYIDFTINVNAEFAKQFGLRYEDVFLEFSDRDNLWIWAISAHTLLEKPKFTDIIDFKLFNQECAHDIEHKVPYQLKVALLPYLNEAIARLCNE